VPVVNRSELVPVSLHTVEAVMVLPDPPDRVHPATPSVAGLYSRFVARTGSDGMDAALVVAVAASACAASRAVSAPVRAVTAASRAASDPVRAVTAASAPPPTRCEL